MAKLTEEQREWFTSYLAEGMHTAFRKASDSYRASRVHDLIASMPEHEWAGIVAFISQAMLDGIEKRILDDDK